jgi:hypothetical protein
MTIQQPVSSNTLSSPDHSLSHRVFANDDAAPIKTIVVDASGNVLIGNQGATNYLNIATTGLLTLVGTAKGKLNLRPTIIQKASKTAGDPTEVYRGCNVGYSFPVWNSNNEELYFRIRIPNRWDGTTDPQFGIMTTLSAAEDVGDKFKFQLEWQTTNPGDVMSVTTSSVVSEQVLLTGRVEAYDAYTIFFTFDADDINNPIVAGEMLQGRLRRIASGTPAVTGEIMIWDWSSMWCVNKMFPVWSVEANAS